jgi:hypothetical protein
MQLVYQVADLWADIIIKRAQKRFMRHAGAGRYPLSNIAESNIGTVIALSINDLTSDVDLLFPGRFGISQHHENCAEITRPPEKLPISDLYFSKTITKAGNISLSNTFCASIN